MWPLKIEYFVQTVVCSSLILLLFQRRKSWELQLERLTACTVSWLAPPCGFYRLIPLFLWTGRLPQLPSVSSESLATPQMSGHFNVTSPTSTLVQEDVFSGEPVSFIRLLRWSKSLLETLRERRRGMDWESTRRDSADKHADRQSGRRQRGLNTKADRELKSYRMQ